ncbi:hypothetical protein NIA73_01190 [Anaerobutyricum hallii]|nr:hypothetical protein [Anaerobutyricum hallii]
MQKIEYTEKGFVITIPKLYRGEAATIKLTCTAKEKPTIPSQTSGQTALKKQMQIRNLLV